MKFQKRKSGVCHQTLSVTNLLQLPDRVPFTASERDHNPVIDLLTEDSDEEEEKGAEPSTEPARPQTKPSRRKSIPNGVSSSSPSSLI
jgi:hypothetical protein